LFSRRIWSERFDKSSFNSLLLVLVCGVVGRVGDAFADDVSQCQPNHNGYENRSHPFPELTHGSAPRSGCS
jgi:hypothetical protein